MARTHVAQNIALAASLILTAACGGQKEPETPASAQGTTTTTTTSGTETEGESGTTGGTGSQSMMGPGGSGQGQMGTSHHTHGGSMAGGGTTTTGPGGTMHDTSMSATGTGADTARLTDAQISHILETANTAEVEAGRMALGKARDARVKRFAQTMVDQHGDANKKLTSLMQKNNMTAAESSASQRLRSDAQNEAERLRAKTGADFDQAYIDAQVKQHQEVLDTIDQKLLPSATNDELRSQLQQMRAHVATHLNEAQQIQASLGGGAGAGSTTGAGGTKGASGTGGTGAGTGGTGTGGAGTGGTGTRGTGGAGTGAGTGGAGTGGSGGAGSGGTTR
jgi:putative membrane protein